jgi:hypothetical protein
MTADSMTATWSGKKGGRTFSQLGSSLTRRLASPLHRPKAVLLSVLFPSSHLTRSFAALDPAATRSQANEESTEARGRRTDHGNTHDHGPELTTLVEPSIVLLTIWGEGLLGVDLERLGRTLGGSFDAKEESAT